MSYPGFYATMAALSGHPALKAVSPQAPILDWFKGDDVHHNGALMLLDIYSFAPYMFKKHDNPVKEDHGLESPVADFLNGIDGDKCVGIGGHHVVHQLFVFLLVNDGDDLFAGFSVVGTDAFVDGGTAVKIMENERENLVELGRDDADAPLDIHAENEVIQDNTAQVGADHTQHNSLGIVAKCGTQCNHHTGQGHCLTQIHSKVFVHDLCHDVNATGRSIVGKEDGQTDTDNQCVGYHIQELILRDGLLLGEQDFEDAQDHRKQQTGIDCLDAKFGSNQQIAQNQQNGIDHERNDGYRHGDKVADHQSQSRCAANRYMAWEHEEIDGNGHDGGTKSNDEKVLNGLFGGHRINLADR